MLLAGGTILFLGPQNGILPGFAVLRLDGVGKPVEVGLKVLVANCLLLWRESIVSIFLAQILSPHRRIRLVFECVQLLLRVSLLPSV